MTNDQYATFEVVARPAMQRAMAAMYAELQSLGMECDPPAEIDHDIERGTACGLLLSVIGPDGVFIGDWSPYNYTDEVGTSDPEEIVRRVELMTPVDLARSVHERILDWAARKSDPAAAPRG